MDPELQALLTRLAEASVRNLASTVQDKIRASKAKNNSADTIATLEEIINEMLAERAELLRVAQGLESALAGQRLSEEDVEFVTEHLLPIIAEMTNGDGVPQLEVLLSTEALTILQIVGFNYREAIGRPLTEVVSAYVANLAPGNAKRTQQKRK